MFVGFMLILLFELASCTGRGHRIHQEELEKYRPLESFVELKGGEFFMGINDREGINGEYPPRKAIVQPFRIHLYPVTIASFKKYKNEKFKHKTDAEQAGISWVFDRLVDPSAELDHHVRDDENDPDCKEARNMSMVRVHEARWNRPEGGNSSIYHRLNLPVVHVSYNDAFAYCAWMHMRLPTEIEWEYAARGGLQEKLYPWGDKWQVGRSNLWQGRFPVENQERDKFYGLSPVDAYSAQNDYEMHDVLGNVWEWTSTIYRREIKRKGNEESDLSGDRRVLKGGSFMDNRDGENRPDRAKIRISARTGRLRTYSAYNVGFRCVQTIEPNERGVDFSKSSFNVVKLRAPKKFVPHDDL